MTDEFHELDTLRRRLAELEGLEEALQRKTYQQERLLETARDLTSSLDLNEVLVRIGNAAKELLTAYGSAIYLLEPDGEFLRPAVAFEPYEEEILAARIPVEGSFTGRAIQSRRSLVFNNATESPSGYQIPGTPVEEEEHVIVAPLIVDDVVLGGMCLNRLGQPFTHQDLALVETLARYAEIALKNARTHRALQHQVEERQRAEAALHTSLVELQARNEELDAFCHTVAHDLQNPLAVIVGTAEVLEAERDLARGQDLGSHLRTIVQSGRKMNNIIEELLLLAQVRRGEVEMDPLDMESLVAEAQRRLADLIEAHEAAISLPDDWPVALGYGPWIEQVWINYLSNAVKYGGRPPRIELGFTPDAPAEIEKGGSQIRFWVRDNGPGLSQAEQGRLFTPFTRLSQIRTRGHGLGLSIVYRIVDKLGGEVGVESEPGRGSLFFFTLPAADDPSGGRVAP